MKKELCTLKDFLINKGINENELTPYLEKIEQNMKDKEYGLVWEEQKENVFDLLKTNFPVLNEVKTKEIIKDKNKPINLLIEGDNLESLYILNYTHKNSADIIYIDPPYNTGSKDFIYNDRIVDKEDTWKHSKWLSFMEKRLRLAKELLKDEGVIFISIGDDEVANLKLLCSEILGEDNFVANLTRIAKRTSNKGNYFKSTKDYILVYAKRKTRLNNFGIGKQVNPDDYIYEDEDDKKGKYKKSGASLYQPSLDSRPNQRYYIEAPDGSLIIPPGNVFPSEKVDGGIVKPLSNDDKCWRWSRKTYLENKNKLIFTRSIQSPLLDENRKKAKWNVYDKVYLEDDLESTLQPEDVIYDYVNSQGTKELLGMGIKFPYSKPVGLIKYLIKLTQKGSNITVIDFFGGSGTTSQALIELNNEDGGNRKSILCTNNENDICEKITYERIKKVIEGYPFTGKKETILYKEKLTQSHLKKMEEILKEIEKIKDINKDEFDKITTSFNNGIYSVIGIKEYKDRKEGYNENLKYYKTNLVKDKVDTHENIENLIDKCTNIIQIKEECYEVLENNKIYELINGNQRIAVIIKKPFIYNYEIDKILDGIDTLNKKVIVYTTNSNYLRKGVVTKEFPQHIVNLYNRLNKSL